MEDPVNEKHKLLLKGADYLSASDECLMNLVAGSRERKWFDAIHDLEKKQNEKKSWLSPIAQEFYNKILLEAKKFESMTSDFFQE